MPPANGVVKPGVFSAAWEKALYKAVVGHPDALALQQLAAANPESANTICLGELLLSSLPSGDLERAHSLLSWMFDTNYEPRSDVVANRYFGHRQLQVSIADGVSSVLSAISRDTLGLLLAEFEQSAGKTERAIDVVESLEPTTIAAVSLAELYAEAGRWGDIIELTDGLTNEDDASVYLLIQRGVAFREQNHSDAARESFKEALRLRSRSLRLRQIALIERGKTYLADGKKALARKDFEKVLANDASFEGLTELIAATD